MNHGLKSLNTAPTHQNIYSLGVPSKNNNSIFADIIQIEVDPPPSHPIFDKVLIMLTSLPPLEFLTKITKQAGAELGQGQLKLGIGFTLTIDS